MMMKMIKKVEEFIPVRKDGDDEEIAVAVHNKEDIELVKERVNNDMDAVPSPEQTKWWGTSHK